MLDCKVENYSVESGKDVGYEVGAKMVKNYYDASKEELIPSFIGKDIVEAILSQEGVAGVSILPALNKEGCMQPIIVGTNAEGKLMLNVSTISPEGKLKKQKGIVATGVVSPGTQPLINDGCGWY